MLDGMMAEFTEASLGTMMMMNGDGIDGWAEAGEGALR